MFKKLRHVLDTHLGFASCCKNYLECGISTCSLLCQPKFPLLMRMIHHFLSLLCLSCVLCHHLMYHYWQSTCLDSVEYSSPLRVLNPFKIRSTFISCTIDRISNILSSSILHIFLLSWITS